jgi:hypothetical protein
MSRDKQYTPHEPLVREAPLVVGTSKGDAWRATEVVWTTIYEHKPDEHE